MFKNQFLYHYKKDNKKKVIILIKVIHEHFYLDNQLNRQKS